MANLYPPLKQLKMFFKRKELFENYTVYRNGWLADWLNARFYRIWNVKEPRQLKTF